MVRGIRTLYIHALYTIVLTILSHINLQLVKGVYITLHSDMVSFDRFLDDTKLASPHIRNIHITYALDIYQIEVLIY